MATREFKFGLDAGAPITLDDANPTPGALPVDKQAVARDETELMHGAGRRVGSTRAQREGAVPGYAPGYGFQSPQNIRGGGWGDMFPNQPSGAPRIQAIPTPGVAQNQAPATPHTPYVPAPAEPIQTTTQAGLKGVYTTGANKYGGGFVRSPYVGQPTGPLGPHYIGDETGDRTAEFDQNRKAPRIAAY